MDKKQIATLVVIFLLVGAVAVLGWQVAGARWDREVAEANVRALQDTVRIFQADATDAESRATTAATRFQEQREIDSDSIRELSSALGRAARELNLRQRALTQAQVEFETVQSSLDQALVELEDVRNPQGRPERIAAFQEENDLVQADIVVAVPWDTTQGIEVELVTMVKPFELTYSLACSPDNDAVATFQTPQGITARPRMGTVAPQICFGERPSLGSGFKLSFGNLFLGALIGGVAGLLIGTTVF
jgi:hypothetical protein